VCVDIYIGHEEEEDMDDSVLTIYGGGCESCESISEVLERKREVVSKIYLRYNKIGDENAVKYLFPALCRVSNLLELDLAGNEISDVSCESLASALGDKVTIRVMNLESNKLCRGISILSAPMSKMKQMRVLNLCRNKIDHKSARDLAFALKLMPRLVELRLDENCFGKAGTHSILKSLGDGEHKVLEILGLGRVGIGSGNSEKDHQPCCWYEGMKALRSLKELNLSGNKLGPDGARDLVSIFSDVSQWKTLSKLDLSVNDFFAEGAKILSTTIENSMSRFESLIHINLAWNWFEPAGFEAIKNTFRTFQGLEYLNLCGNKFQDDHKTYLRNQYEKRIGNSGSNSSTSIGGRDKDANGELIL